MKLTALLLMKPFSEANTRSFTASFTRLGGVRFGTVVAADSFFMLAWSMNALCCSSDRFIPCAMRSSSCAQSDRDRTLCYAWARRFEIEEKSFLSMSVLIRHACLPWCNVDVWRQFDVGVHD